MTTPEVVRTVAALRARTREARGAGRAVGFVPTMGALHEGHLRLVEVARERTDLVVVSVFVNPTQFGPGEDLDRYPRTLERDVEACGARDADLVFAPSVEEMYPDGEVTRVRVPVLSEGLCGRFRPGHFEGVATVVAKLFNQVGPCTAVFGRKDYQQLKLIERLVRDLCFDVEVVGVPTVREPDGLAMSSRNAYLSEDERPRARALVEALSAAWRLAATGDGPTAAAIRDRARAVVDAKLDAVDYVDVCDPETLSVLDDEARVTSPALVAIAGRLGATRLIDNVVVLEQPDPLQ